MKRWKVFLMGILLLMGFIIFRPLTLKAEMDQNMDMNMEQGNTFDEKPKVAVKGECPVCILMGMHLAGKDEFTIEYQGKLYKFDSLEHKNMFAADPVKYVRELDNRLDEESKKMEKTENKNDSQTTEGSQMMNGTK